MPGDAFTESNLSKNEDIVNKNVYPIDLSFNCKLN
jgi:hypothetical protein